MGITGIKFKVISKDEFQLDLNHLGLSKEALLSHPKRNEMLLFLLPRAVSLPLQFCKVVCFLCCQGLPSALIQVTSYPLW